MWKTSRWYNDREMWPRVPHDAGHAALQPLQPGAGHRLRLPARVTDAYFLFAYPFFLLACRATTCACREPARRGARPQSRNAEVHQRADRGPRDGVPTGPLDARLPVDQQPPPQLHHRRPDAPRTTRPYCRDALRAAAEGVPRDQRRDLPRPRRKRRRRGQLSFWKTVFDGVAHAAARSRSTCTPRAWTRGMIDTCALGTGHAGQGVAEVSGPSTWACRTTRRTSASWSVPQPGHDATGLMALSAGSRSFLRYGYGDLLREDRNWRAAPHLAGHAAAAALGRSGDRGGATRARSTSAAASGVEIMEPLSFKGRRGSGIAGDRCGVRRCLAAAAVGLGEVRIRYRVWGRLLYNPHADPEPGGATCDAVRPAAAGRERRWPTPAAFCRSSRRRTALRPRTTLTGRRCT